MANAGFFRGTSMDQDSRFKDKQKKLMKTMTFPAIYDHPTKVDMTKVKLDVLKPWITEKIGAIVGEEDDVVVEFVFNHLEQKSPDPRDIQINLTGFLEKHTRGFMEELWKMLISACENGFGIPTELLTAKMTDISQRQMQEDKNRELLNQQKAQLSANEGFRKHVPAEEVDSTGGPANGVRRGSPSPTPARARSRSRSRSPAAGNASGRRQASRSKSPVRRRASRSRSKSRSPVPARRRASRSPLRRRSRSRSRSPRSHRGSERRGSDRERRSRGGRERRRSRSPRRDSRSPVRRSSRSPRRRRSPAQHRGSRRSPSPRRESRRVSRRTPSPRRETRRSVSPPPPPPPPPAQVTDKERNGEAKTVVTLEDELREKALRTLLLNKIGQKEESKGK